MWWWIRHLFGVVISLYICSLCGLMNAMRCLCFSRLYRILSEYGRKCIWIDCLFFELFNLIFGAFAIFPVMWLLISMLFIECVFTTSDTSCFFENLVSKEAYFVHVQWMHTLAILMKQLILHFCNFYLPYS